MSDGLNTREKSTPKLCAVVSFFPGNDPPPPGSIPLTTGKTGGVNVLTPLYE